ncbi:MAG: 50S ribosomal protein L29 [Anaerolineae bacterium]|nr:50S ribosomal protein L29 [Anaerolineae bacterium]
MSKAAEIRNMTDGEIEQALDDTKEELFNLRFQWEIGQLEDYKRIRILKKHAARLMTIKRERELAAALVQQEETNA